MSNWVLSDQSEPPVILRIPKGITRTVGRTAQADFMLDAPLISRVHCRLTADPSGQLVVEDLESQNGTYVNGQRVERATLKTGDQLTIGRVEFTVQRQQ